MTKYKRSPKFTDERLKKVAGDDVAGSRGSIPTNAGMRKKAGEIEGLHSLPERDSFHDDVSPEQQAENERSGPPGQPGKPHKYK